MITELLKHHVTVIEKIAAGQGTTESVVSQYIVKHKKFYPQVLSVRSVLLELVEQKRQSGTHFETLSESVNQGDVICAVCSNFGKDCWHGHKEYNFTFPNGTEEKLPLTTWKQFGVDIQASIKVNTFPLRRLIGENNIEYLELIHRVCSDQMLPGGVRMMEFMGFPHATPTGRILSYVRDLGEGLINLGGDGMEVLIKISDNIGGTSMRPGEFLQFLRSGVVK